MKNKKEKIWKEKDLKKFTKNIDKIFYFTYGTEIYFKDDSRMMYRDERRYFIRVNSKKTNQAEKLKTFIDSIQDDNNRKKFIEVLLTQHLILKE